VRAFHTGVQFGSGLTGADSAPLSCGPSTGLAGGGSPAVVAWAWGGEAGFEAGSEASYLGSTTRGPDAVSQLGSDKMWRAQPRHWAGTFHFPLSVCILLWRSLRGITGRVEMINAPDTATIGGHVVDPLRLTL